MSCAIWEERVALFAGDDLEMAEAAGVERHLGECAACRALEEDLRSSLHALREAHAEPMAAHYAAVRARVLAELARPQRRAAWVWACAAAVAVVAAAALVVVMMRPAAVRAPELPRAAAPQRSQSGADTLARARPPGRAGELARNSQTGRQGKGPMTAQAPNSRLRRAQAANQLPLAEAELASLPGFEMHDLLMAEVAAPPDTEAPVHMVQLATDDPNVVIYWQLEETGDSGGA